jgi:fatty-acyl-CoA synthase/fatty acid CoA ligase FadD22
MADANRLPERPGSGNLAGVLEATARANGWWPQAAVTVDGRTWTHGDVHEGGARAAAVLAALGIGHGHRVLLGLDDRVEFAWAFLGAVRLGAVAVPVNPRLTPAEHHDLLADCAPTAVVCEDDLTERFAGFPVVSASGLSERLDEHVPAAPCVLAGEAPAYAQYTSGTTGPPKAAVHRHCDPPVYAEAFAGPALGLVPGDVVLSVSKLYFAYGLGNALFFPLLSGCRAVWHPRRPTPKAVAQLASSEAVSVLFAVPTFYARLLTAVEPEAFAAVRAAVSAGESLKAALAQRTRAFLECPVLDGLGSTEVGQTFVSNTLDHWRDGTVGRVLAPYEIAVRDDAGQEQPAGEEGMLWVRGPTVMTGYLDKPQATASVFDGDWLATGDRAMIDAEGFVHLQGRADDVELVAGISVTPGEIEELLATHAAVNEVAVAGVQHADGSSQLEAFIVPAPEVCDHDRVADELLTLACDHLPPYKAPRVVRWLDALPRTPTGKLRRFVLRSASG